MTVVAYDGRGHGESPVSAAPFTHAGDLLAVLDRVGAGRAWLVGASAGGGLAPDRVAGLVLLGTAVSGAPEPDLDPDTQCPPLAENRETGGSTLVIAVPVVWIAPCRER